MGFFLVSLVVSGSVQVAVRNLGEVRFSWDGVLPPLIQGRYDFTVGTIATGATNIAVRWRLEASDAVSLNKFVASGLIALKSDGLLTIKDQGTWAANKPAKPFECQAVASSLEKPELQQTVLLRIQ